MKKFRTRCARGPLALLFFWSVAAFAETNSLAAASPATASFPNAGESVVRVLGAFVLVVALFLAGAWLFRNWQRIAVQKTGGAKLSIIEAKSIGQRQAVYVVGYQQQRMLLASSPAGITLISHLPNADETEIKAPSTRLNFADALQQVLGKRQ